ncbi:MAG TPA: alkaline phosphatase family protein [Vicinamibacteria bacterium]
MREELRRLGYLDSRLDRFVLAAAGTSPLHACRRVAARLGLAGGALFGLTLSLGAAGLDPRLLADSADLAVLSLYLVAALAAVTTVAALVAGLTAAWCGRRGRTPPPDLSRKIGLTLSLAALAYLVPWWQSHAADAPVAYRLAAAFVGLGLSLALGRFGAMASVAVLAAGGGSGRLPEAAASRGRTLPLLAAVALLLGAAVSAAAYFASADGDIPDYAVVPSDVRVRVLGVDGLDPRMVDQMIARREMPRMAALLKSGARGRLRVEPERVPAIVWTTIATGRRPEDDGILPAGARVPLFPGDERRVVRMAGRAWDLLRLTHAPPPTTVLREVKPFWSVASEKGLRVGVVNWRATWPADPVNGYVVSDRAFFTLERRGPRDREAPPAAFARLEEAGLKSAPDRARRLDLFALDAADLLRGAHPPELEAIYLPGLDIATVEQLGEAGGSDLATLDARLDAVRSYYRFTDGLIGRAVDGLEPGEVLMLVGDPGRLARRAVRAPEGVLVIIGGPAVTVDLGEVSERDVAPTLLHLLGLPVSRELPGSPLEAALDPAFRRSHPVRAIASYGRRPASRPEDGDFDREMVDQLRSLGYVP